MSEFEDSANDIITGAMYKIAYEQRGLYGFHNFQVGSKIIIELIGEQVSDLEVEPSQLILGQLLNAKRAYIDVHAASHQPKIVGHPIGLALRANMATPAGSIQDVHLKCCVAANRTFSYYFLRDVLPDAPYEMPTDFHDVAARYGKVVVAGTTLFDSTK